MDEHGPVSGADRPAMASTGTPKPYDFDTLPSAELAPPTAQQSPQLRRLLHLPAVLASCALLVGAVAGGYVVHQHNVGRAAAQQRSALQAVAIAENQLASGINGVRVATLTVRLTNFGPKPIRPVLSPDNHTPSQVAPLVQASTGQPEAEANGGSAMVTMTVPLACDQELGDLLLPVRTVDHLVHQVLVHSPDSAALQQDRTMCYDGRLESSNVAVSMAGSIDRPYLEFTNQSQQGRRMWLRTEDNDMNPLQGVRISLGHSFPMDLDPQATVRVPLRVHVNRCIKDAAQLESVQMWLAFQETDLGHARVTDSNWDNVTGTSVGAAVTAAVLRRCTTP